MGAIVGEVLTVNKQPIADAAVMVASGPTHSDVAALTDERGAFRLGDLESGRYVIEVDAEGYVSRQGRVPVRSERATHVHIVLQNEYVPEIDESTNGLLLVGTRWMLTSYRASVKSGIKRVLRNTEVTAIFGIDGGVAGSAGCNSYSGSFTVQGDRLTVSSLGRTEMFCEPTKGELPKSIMNQEDAYLADLPQAAKFKIDGSQLVVFDACGAQLMEFQATDLPLKNPQDTDSEWEM